MDMQQQPDLASILRTLSAYTPTSSPSILQPQTPTPFVNDAPSDREEGEYDPAEYDPSAPATAPSTHPPPQERRAPIATTAPPATSSSSAADPRSITAWPAALQHVTRLLGRSDASTARVRRLIAEQHAHEKQWWGNRDALVKAQRDRVEGRRRVGDVLRAVGGMVDDSIADSSPEEDAAELARYDKKVHRACTEMAKATTEQLVELGVPFFGTRPSLLLFATEGATTTTTATATATTDGPGKKAGEPVRLLTSDELLALQRRMLELLEDLCKD